MLWKSQRDSLSGRLQFGNNSRLGFPPIQILRRIVPFPESPLSSLTGEFRDGLKALALKGLDKIRWRRANFRALHGAVAGGQR